MEAWYVVHVKRYQERHVERYLSLQDIPAFLPLVEVDRRRHTRRVRFLEPLFPGYMFAYAAAPSANPVAWRTLQWAPGVQRILGVGGHPQPVPDEVVAAIRARTRDLGFVRPGLPFPPGARVRITHGPLTGLEAVFDCALSRLGRVRVLLELLGQWRGAELDGCDLEAV